MNGDARFEAGPYRGLRSFGDSDLDALLFFGRERERAVLVANLLASRLTLLYGPSGVGKSSLVRAGVAHELRAQIARDGGRVVVFDRWAGDPRAGLIAAIEQACGPLGPTAGLTDAAAAAIQGTGAPLYLVLDQFEEYFLYHGAGPLAGELPELVGRPGLEVNVLISLRDDALSQLDVFKARIPNLFSNVLRLDRLEREGGRTAIVAPLQPFAELTGRPVTIEPELVEKVLDQVAVDEGGIEAPYLQLVLERLWREETGSGSTVLRLSTLSRLGGAEAIVHDHLRGALVGLGDRRLDAAAAVLNQLVTPSGTKIAHRAEDLAQYAQLPAAELQPLLGKLQDERILRRIEASGSEPERFEIFHDVLAGPIAAWRSSWALERERRASSRQRRRLLLLTGAAFAALAVVIAIAVFALVQRSHARADARRAQARELAANALAELPTDGQRALADALQAARLSAGEQTEDVLRQALIGSHERAIVRMGSAVGSTSFNAAGDRALVASANGVVRLLDRRGRVLWTRRVPSPLAGASFSADNSMVIAAGGKEVHVWNVAGGHELEQSSFRDPVSSLGVAPSPSRRAGIVLVGQRSSVAIFSLLEERMQSRLATPGEPVSLVPNRDGSMLAAIVRDRGGATRAYVFDLESGRLLHALPGRKITAVAFSPDGRLLATGSEFPVARLFDARSGRLLHSFEHKGRVLSLAFSPDGSMLATGSSDGATRVWDTSTGSRLLLLTGQIGAIESVAFSAGGRFLIAGSSDRTALVYEADNGRQLALLTGHTDSVTQVAMSPDEELALTGSADGTARLWDPGVTAQLRPLDRGVEAVRQVAYGRAVFHSKEQAFIVRGRTIRVHGVDRELYGFAQPDSPILATAFSPNSRLLAVAVPSEIMILVDGVPDAGFETPDGALGPHPSLSGALVWAGNDTLLAATRRGVHVWDLTPLRAFGGVMREAFPGTRGERTFDAGGPVSIVAGSIDDSKAAALSRGIVTLWNPRSGKQTGRLATRANAVAFSPDGKLLVTTYGNKAVLWTADGRRIAALNGHRGTIIDFAFSPDSKLLVTGSIDHDARVWSLPDGKPVSVLRGHLSPIYGVATSPDGRWVVTAGQRTVGLWRSASGELLFFLSGPTKPITSVAFGPDGRSILAGSKDGSAYLYSCDVCGNLASLEALAEERLSLAPAAAG